LLRLLLGAALRQRLAAVAGDEDGADDAGEEHPIDQREQAPPAIKARVGSGCHEFDQP
jgi:hypothetical protein